jgi:glycine betaine/proline transport system substrate-binding protein
VDVKGKTLARLAAIAATLVLVVSACSGAASSPAASTPATSSPAASTVACGTVNLAVNPWVGYEANAAVVAYILEKELGCTVVKKDLKEEISWQGFETGEVDAILENWGHLDLVKAYIDEKKVAQDAGLTGNEGIIGWYVPTSFAEANPDILTADKDPQVLNRYADQFKSSESGDKGQLLDGDPSYVTNDEALVANLGLNFKVIYSGSEAASNKAIKQAVDQGKPILAYYYEPNWFSAQVALTHVALPPYTDGCDADPKKVACDYPPYHLNKIVSTKFAESGSPAFTVVKNFSWTNEDQNSVANDIANNNMSDAEAAKKWVEANPDTWKAWLPS